MELIKIEGNDRYFIEESGRVWDRKSKRYVTITKKDHNLTGGSYFYFNMQIGDKRLTVAHHRVVATQFLSNPKNYPEVDHIDGNSLNNSPSNLRWVSKKENQQNKSKHKNNTSGVTGVSFLQVRDYSYWRASWRDENGKQKSRSFSVSEFGYEIARQKAINCRQEQLQMLNCKGQHYTDRHGG